MSIILSIQNLNKFYKGNFQAFKNINLDIRKEEIFALLGPNGAGKTTLINSVKAVTLEPTSWTFGIGANPKGIPLGDGDLDIHSPYDQLHIFLNTDNAGLPSNHFFGIWHGDVPTGAPTEIFEIRGDGQTYVSGDLGVGTTTPTARVTIAGDNSPPNLNLLNLLARPTDTWPWTIGFNKNLGSPGEKGNLAIHSVMDTVEFFLNTDGAVDDCIPVSPGTQCSRFRILHGDDPAGAPTKIFEVQGDGQTYISGKVGIDTINPTAQLHVNGNIKATLTDFGAGTAMLYVGGEIGYDVAEIFEATEEVEVGDVLVISPNEDIKLQKSFQPYDRTVAGIVSGAPAILFQGSQLEIALVPHGFQQGTKPPLALAGRVLCKVTLEGGPIKRGDLLTTSSTPGHAMKANDPHKYVGAIVGKALEPFSDEKNAPREGKIMVLLTLQ